MPYPPGPAPLIMLIGVQVPGFFVPIVACQYKAMYAWPRIHFSGSGVSIEVCQLEQYPPKSRHVG